MIRKYIKEPKLDCKKMGDMLFDCSLCEGITLTDNDMYISGGYVNNYILLAVLSNNISQEKIKLIFNDKNIMYYIQKLIRSKNGN